jgi:hypothetical protein
MKKIIAAISIAFLLAGCTPANYKPTKTSLELQAFQAKEFDTQKKIAFASTLSVFQDLGYSITASDMETGYIAAKSPTQHEMGFGKVIMKDTRTTAFIEELRPGITKVRLSFVNNEEWSSSYGAKLVQDNPIEDPTVYNNAFTKIQEAIFIRSATK